MPLLDDLACICDQRPRVSDIILSPGAQIAALCNDALIETAYRFDQADLAVLLKAAGLPDSSPFPAGRCLPVRIAGHRLRAQFSRALGSERVIVRPLPSTVPTASDLRVPKKFLETALSARRGLILVGGDTGSGKSSTLASVLHERAPKAEHIYTIEDPVEFIHEGVHPLQFLQQEVGTDVPSFAAGLDSAVRSAPRIIMIGEIRDPLSTMGAINAALTGHLVFSTLHTGSVSLTVESLLKWVPEDRMQQTRALAPTLLLAVLCQRLLPDGKGGRFAIHELLFPSPSVKNYIETGKYVSLQDEIDQGAASGNISFKRSFEAAVRDGLVAPEARREIEQKYLPEFRAKSNSLVP